MELRSQVAELRNIYWSAELRNIYWSAELRNIYWSAELRKPLEIFFGHRLSFLERSEQQAAEKRAVQAAARSCRERMISRSFAASRTSASDSKAAGEVR